MLRLVCCRQSPSIHEMTLSSAFLLLSAVVLTTAKTNPEDCSGLLQGGGTCMPIKTCSSVIEMVKEALKYGVEGNLGQKKAIVAAIRKIICGDVKLKKVCCADNLDQHFMETTQAPVEKETTEAPVEKETTQAPVEKETTEAPVEQETTQAPVEKETTEFSPLEKEPAFIGDFLHGIHRVGGKVFAKGHNTILIKGFTYDGAGPDAFLWAGNTTEPDSEALEEEFVNAVLPYPFSGEVNAYRYEDKDIPILGAFHQPTDIELQLPDHVSVEDLHWISVWCRDFQVNFGHVTFPHNFRLN